jgi:CBS-domain-containing membrane protein
MDRTTSVDSTPLAQQRSSAPGQGRVGAGAQPPAGRGARAGRAFVRYLRKMAGTSRGSPPRVSWAEVLWSWIGAFLGIGAVALVGTWLLSGTDVLLMIGSLGASAVLVYGAPRSPLAQPRNLVGGHVVSAAVGVLCYQLIPPVPGLAEATAVATAIALMHLTRTLHPPGGATALIAVIGSEQLHALGWLYVLAPAGLGALILLGVGLLVNNAVPSRRYPEFWV